MAKVACWILPSGHETSECGRVGPVELLRKLITWILPRRSYPHLTTLVLNAGMGAFSGLSWPAAARQFFTDIVGCVSAPDYIIQEAGKLSADGRRGGVWGVNVLSAYILVRASNAKKGSDVVLNVGVYRPRNSDPTCNDHPPAYRSNHVSSTSPPHEPLPNSYLNPIQPRIHSS